MRLSFAFLPILLRAPGYDAFSTTRSRASTSFCHWSDNNGRNIIITPLLSSKSDGNERGDSDGGWYDDYDDFVSNLDFEGGGWDKGADSPFDGGGGGGGGRGYSNRGGGRDRGGYGGGNGRNYRSGGGHDYERDPRDGPSSVDEAKVNELLASRLHYRKKRQYDAADDIRDELLNDHGVTVWDKDRTWSTSRGGGGGGSRGGGGRGDGGRGRNRNDGFESRGRGRGGGRGRGRERQFNEFGHDYSQTGGPVDPSVCTLAENEIHDLIRERMECKFARDFANADGIESQLRQSGVDVHDGFKEWRADGEQWARSNRRESTRGNGGYGGGPSQPKIYSQRGPGKGLTDEQIAAIGSLVAERSEAKSITDYDRADEIFDRLANEYEVNVDDRNREWALLHEEYLLNEDDTSFVPSEDIQAMVGKKLGERVQARKGRDFALADEIREDLRRDYVVEVDDQTKEWIVVAPEGARWSGVQDDDGEGGDENIVSREEWDDEEDEVHGGLNDDESFGESTDGDEDGGGEIEDSVNTSDESVLTKMTVPKLKEKLREVGLPV
eukprot:CAMPEP_0181132418 /NCGR_PEP_ID=MMETSP1071-20121207/30983_1 /TAXON_ID=35127 /ORGANISM="Thalassiosira sp., Strain NH16" /LENGTH=552 /DNA_ID=CAMNT_0023218747 /DNA_START=133 /DNA_END=1788 /DNA_ORIENTATION=-